ncbi:MAG: hypothetical protein RIA63_10075 [Cyclobacteriaceae bacterium]
MKTLGKLLIILVALQFACSKDDEVENGGTFTLGGTTYILSKGFLVDEGGQYGIILTSSGISLASSTGDDFTGTGDYVVLYVITSSATSFVPGTFLYSDSGGPNTIEYAEVGVNLDVSANVEGIEATAGTATVTLSGGIYTITFSMTTDSGAVTGTYMGPLTDVQD